MGENKCAVCGNKIGGIFGLEPPTSEAIAKAKSFGVYTEGACFSCTVKAVNQYAIKHGETEEDREGFIAEEKVRSALEKVFCTPSNVISEGIDLGLVTGYCVMGTGPIAEFLSSWTDFFGSKSGSYLNKIRTAEKHALDMLKAEAIKKGGDAVFCCRVSLSEATSGHGMLMVSATGAVIRTNSYPPEMEEAKNIALSFERGK